MASLYGAYPPTWTVPQALTRRRPVLNPATSAVSWRFDPELGDFARDARGRALIGSPLETTLLWGARAASIQRAGWPIFARSWGVGFRRILRRGGPRRTVEQALEADMKRATGPGPSGGRIRDMVDFAFDWPGDNRLYVAYTLILSDGTRHRSGTEIAL